MHSYDTTIFGIPSNFLYYDIASVDCILETIMADLLVSQTGWSIRLVLNL